MVQWFLILSYHIISIRYVSKKRKVNANVSSLTSSALSRTEREQISDSSLLK